MQRIHCRPRHTTSSRPITLEPRADAAFFHVQPGSQKSALRQPHKAPLATLGKREPVMCRVGFSPAGRGNEDCLSGPHGMKEWRRPPRFQMWERRLTGLTTDWRSILDVLSTNTKIHPAVLLDIYQMLRTSSQTVMVNARARFATEYRWRELQVSSQAHEAESPNQPQSLGSTRLSLLPFPVWMTTGARPFDSFGIECAKSLYGA